ncbi:MAG: hypothetical protein DLM59_07535 [Pseudonocardiales bacterium]|nr:MAG: hypothetical protein DLM59_07535 [Pseudonocardiales bacterium]
MAILAAATLGVTGCSLLTRPGTQKTITLAQAEQRANSYAQQISQALPGRPGLVPNAGGVIPTECGDPNDNGPQGRSSAGGGFFLEPLSQDRIPEVFTSFRGYLTKRGFKVLTDQSDFLVMTNPKDGFRVGLQEGGDATVKGLGLIVSSPCVWPNGTPPSK